MKTVRLTITLLDDVVLSRRNATTGAHETLDRIPGSALLGCAAAQLYDRLKDSGEAWTVFHSGRVRFGDALPLADDGTQGWPVPLAWHENKADPGGRALDDEKWHPERVFNLAAEPRPEVGGLFQPRGLRQGYVTADGRVVPVLTRYRMMTAIGADGRVEPGQLFGYQSVLRGQRFGAELRFDADVGDELRRRVLGVFREGSLRIGRSKATQYGRANVVVGDETPFATVPAASDELLRVWLLADAGLRDKWGQPTLDPAIVADSLPGAELDAPRSFVRARRYSPWNAHRALPELERQVLVSGSVLTLRRAGGFASEDLTALAWRGIGCGGAAGLGAVAVQPALLGHLQPVAVPAKPAYPARHSAGAKDAAESNSPLLLFLRSRAAHSSHVPRVDDWAQQMLRALVGRWVAIRAYHGWPALQAHGPGATHWGSLAALAGQCRTLAEFRLRLLGPDLQADDQKDAKKVDGLVRAEDDNWDRADHKAPQGSEGMRSLRDWLRGALQDVEQTLSDETDRLDALQRLFGRVRRARPWESQISLEACIGEKREGRA